MDYQVYSLNRDDSKKEVIGQMHNAPEDKDSHTFAMFFCAWVTAYEKRHARENGYDTEPVITPNETLDQITAQERATHYAFVGSPDMVNLYRTTEDGQAESLQLARVGAGLRDHANPDIAAAFEKRDDWFRIATQQWEPIDEIPVNSPLWPAKPV